MELKTKKLYVFAIFICLVPFSTHSQSCPGLGYKLLSQLFPNHISTTTNTGFTPITESERRKGSCEGDECHKVYFSEKTYELVRQLTNSIKEDVSKRWILVGENKECDNGRDLDKGRLNNVQQCADRCRPIATMFTFEATNQGYCRCQRAASAKGTCRMRDAHGKTLYKYNNLGSRDLPARSFKRNTANRPIPIRNSDGSVTWKKSCVKRGTMEQDGTKTLCVECNARTVLPVGRYPRYINEIICDNTDNYCMTYQGSCQQNYIYFNFKRDVRKVGIRRKNEWVTYSQPVRNGCHCQLFGGSVFDAFI